MKASTSLSIDLSNLVSIKSLSTEADLISSFKVFISLSKFDLVFLNCSSWTSFLDIRLLLSKRLEFKVLIWLVRLVAKVIFAFNSLKWIVTIGWAIYPIGYYLNGPGASPDLTNIVYNFADLVNKAMFGLVIWAAAKSDK